MKEEIVNPKARICKVHNIKKVRKYNSGLYFCPKCESGKRIKKNRELLRQSFATNNTPKNGLKPKSGGKKKSSLGKRLDDAWSKLVRLRAGNKCEYCGKTKGLNSHHIYSRAKMSLRWMVKNGVCLCVGHHIGVQFSAHKTPVEFIDWLTNKKGDEYMQELRLTANSTAKYHDFEKEILLKELLEEIKAYEES